MKRVYQWKKDTTFLILEMYAKGTIYLICLPIFLYNVEVDIDNQQ